MKWINQGIIGIVLALTASVHAIQPYNQVNIRTNIGYPPGDHPVPLTNCLKQSGIPITGVHTTIWYGAAVEPSIAVKPTDSSVLVACWQQERISNGGSLEVGIAYSDDSGATWDRTTIPLQICKKGGINQRVSDVWLSYGPNGDVLYFSALVLNATENKKSPNQTGVIFAVSHDDGKTWSIPLDPAGSNNYLTEPTAKFPSPDKNSVTASRNESNVAFATWDTFNPGSGYHSNTLFSRTTNGGQSWRRPQLLYNPFPDLTSLGLSNGIKNDCQTIDNIIVEIPNNPSIGNPSTQGDLLNFTIRLYAPPGTTNKQYENEPPAMPIFKHTLLDYVCVRSKDLGRTWDTTATVVFPATKHNPVVYTGGYNYNKKGIPISGKGTLMRTSEVIPSPAINGTNGNLYVVFQTSELRKDKLPQIGIRTSRDGGFTWSETARASRTPKNCPNPQAFSPAVAVTSDGYVGILYSDFRNDNKFNKNKTNTDTWLVVYKEVSDSKGGSTGIGLDFVNEVRLSENSYIAQNGPITTQGTMTTGDYPFIVADSTNAFVSVHTESHNGPFKKAEVFAKYNSGGKLFVDNNYRQSPIFTRVQP